MNILNNLGQQLFLVKSAYNRIIKKQFFFSYLFITIVFACSGEQDLLEKEEGFDKVEISVNENVANGTVLGRVSVENDNNLIYNKTDHAYDHLRFGGTLDLKSIDPFVINSSTGEIIVKDNWYYDYETFNNIFGSVSVSRNGENLGTISVSIKLEDVDDVSLYFEKVEHSGLRFSSLDGHKSLVFKNKIWIIGGWTGSELSNAIWTSSNGEQWEEILVQGDVFSPRDGLQAVVFKDRIWVIGGGFNDVWSTSNGVVWNKVTTSTPIFSRRSNHQVVVFKGKLWVIGGFSYEDGSSINDVWSSSDGINWVQENTTNNIFSPRYFHEAIVFKNKIFVFGGITNSVSKAKEVWSSSDGINWNEQTIIGKHFSDLSTPKAIVFNNRLWIIGGGNSYRFSSITRFDDFAMDFEAWSSEDGTNWNRETTGNKDFSRITGHQVVGYNNKAWVIGGDNRNEIWVSK